MRRIVPGRRLARRTAALAIVPALALAGCGKDEALPKAHPSPAPSSAPAVITDRQLDSILEKVGSTVGAADGKRNVKQLKQRATGPALAQREAAYGFKKKSKKYSMPPALATDKVVRNVTSATTDWPRVTTVITSGNKQTQALVLSQKDPRAPYKLWSQTTLLSGGEVPEVNDARQGSALLDPGAKGYAATPKQTVADYAKGLDQGAKSKPAKRFGSDSFAKQIAEGHEKQKKALKSGNADVKFGYEPGKQLSAQATTSGALVFGTITETTTITPESKDGETGKLNISKPQSDIVGETSSSQELQQKVTYNVVFKLPKSGKMTLLGVTGVMTGAKLH